MRTVFLYSPGIVNQYILTRVKNDFLPACFICENQSPWQTLKRTFNRKNDSISKKFDKLLFYLFYILFYDHRVKRGLAERLNVEDDFLPDLTVSRINQHKALEYALQFQPALVVVLGTSILGKGWLNSGLRIINVHTGIMPDYRGRFCWFWPVVNGQPEKLGVSIHRVTNVVDGGGLVKQLHAESSRLTDFSIVSILLEMAELSVEGLMQIYEKPTIIDEPTPLNNPTEYPIYFEPGLRDFLRFLKS